MWLCAFNLFTLIRIVIEIHGAGSIKFFQRHLFFRQNADIGIEVNQICVERSARYLID